MIMFIESPVNGRQLRLDQKKDPELASLITDALPLSETDKVSEGYHVKKDILMRKCMELYSGQNCQEVIRRKLSF